MCWRSISRIVRFLFAGTRPNSEFAISFDLDVPDLRGLHTCEHLLRLQEVNESRAKEKDLSEPGRGNPPEASFQIPFRHLCNLLQLHEGDIERAIDTLGEMSESQRERLTVRSRCAWNWITTFSPEDFRYRLMRDDDPVIELSEQERKAVQDLAALVEVMEEIEEAEYTTASTMRPSSTASIPATSSSSSTAS